MRNRECKNSVTPLVPMLGISCSIFMSPACAFIIQSTICCTWVSGSFRGTHQIFELPKRNGLGVIKTVWGEEGPGGGGGSKVP